MKRAFTVTAALAVVVIGGAAFWAFGGGSTMFCSQNASASDPLSGEAVVKGAADAKRSDKVLGKFDVAMAGCRFACGTKAKYDAMAVVPQPGAEKGRLTQCPVSGVVFSVDAERPHVSVGADEYVTCCDTCAEKLRKNPRRFVRV